MRASIHEARYLAKTSDRRVIELKVSSSPAGQAGRQSNGRLCD